MTSNRFHNQLIVFVCNAALAYAPHEGDVRLNITHGKETVASGLQW
jgi:hypothetical protein